VTSVYPAYNVPCLRITLSPEYSGRVRVAPRQQPKPDKSYERRRDVTGSIDGRPTVLVVDDETETLLSMPDRQLDAKRSSDLKL